MKAKPTTRHGTLEPLVLVPDLPNRATSSDAPLMTIHQASLRIRGVLHLLHEALQNGNGIAPTHAAAVCALIQGAEQDLTAVDVSIDELIDAHLDRPRR